MSKVLRLIAAAARSDEKPMFPVLAVFSLLGLVGSLWAALHGIEMPDF
jgi:hypothetical protein